MRMLQLKLAGLISEKLVVGAFAPWTEKRSFLPNSKELGEKLLYFCLNARFSGLDQFL